MRRKRKIIIPNSILNYIHRILCDAVQFTVQCLVTIAHTVPALAVRPTRCTKKEGSVGQMRTVNAGKRAIKRKLIVREEERDEGGMEWTRVR